MIHSISAEVLKLRRRKIFLVIIAIYAILIYIYAIFYLFIILLPSMGIIDLYGTSEFITKYFYPPGSLILIFNELFYQVLPAKSLDLLKPDANILFCILSLLFYFIGLTFVSVQILNKQEN